MLWLKIFVLYMTLNKYLPNFLLGIDHIDIFLTCRRVSPSFHSPCGRRVFTSLPSLCGVTSTKCFWRHLSVEDLSPFLSASVKLLFRDEKCCLCVYIHNTFFKLNVTKIYHFEIAITKFLNLFLNFKPYSDIHLEYLLEQNLRVYAPVVILGNLNSENSSLVASSKSCAVVLLITSMSTSAESFFNSSAWILELLIINTKLYIFYY